MKFFAKCMIVVGIFVGSFFAWKTVDASQSRELKKDNVRLGLENELLKQDAVKLLEQRDERYATLLLALPERDEHLIKIFGIEKKEPEETKEATSQSTQPVVTRPAEEE